jgi:hypothetical protein
MCVRYVHEKIICTEKICFIWDLHGSRPRLVTTNFVRPSGAAAVVELERAPAVVLRTETFERGLSSALSADIKR